MKRGDGKTKQAPEVVTGDQQVRTTGRGRLQGLILPQASGACSPLLPGDRALAESPGGYAWALPRELSACRRLGRLLLPPEQPRAGGLPLSPRRPLCHPSVKSCQPRRPSRQPPWLDPQPRAADPLRCSGHCPPGQVQAPHPVTRGGTLPCSARPARPPTAQAVPTARSADSSPRWPFGPPPRRLQVASHVETADSPSVTIWRRTVQGPHADAGDADAGSEQSTEEDRAGAGPRVPTLHPATDPSWGVHGTGTLVPVVCWVDIQDGLVTSAVHSC